MLFQFYGKYVSQTTIDSWCWLIVLDDDQWSFGFSLLIDATITWAIFFSPKAQFQKHLIIKYAPIDFFLSYDVLIGMEFTILKWQCLMLFIGCITDITNVQALPSWCVYWNGMISLWQRRERKVMLTNSSAVEALRDAFSTASWWPKIIRC